VKVYDSFLFNNELDLLECRLVQMEHWPVYRHILVESPVDHQGHDKPLYYADNRERFAPWADRITHVITPRLPDAADPMFREAAQRDRVAEGLTGVEAGDWLILADVDEIPNDTALAAVKNREVGVLEMICCMFAVDWLWGLPLRTSVILPAGNGGQLSAARRDGWSAGPEIHGAGHHLTWLGGRDGIAAKMAAHCHIECNEDLARGNADDVFYQQGHNPFGKFGYSEFLMPVDVDDSWPRWVYERNCPGNWFRPRAG